VSHAGAIEERTNTGGGIDAMLSRFVEVLV
jgi:hypothetical protein